MTTTDQAPAEKVTTCPRRLSDFGPWDRSEGLDRWRDDNTCSFCGSMNPDEFMAHLEAETGTLGPTDKNYKVYIDTAEPNPEQLKLMGSANHKIDEKGWVLGADVDLSSIDTKGYGTLEPDRYYLVGKRGAKRHGKFYFQHLSDEQKNRFIALYNEKKMKLGYPGHFYRLPYFCGD